MYLVYGIQKSGLSIVNYFENKKIKFEMRFLDECHKGGVSELAKKTLDFYGKDL